MLYSCFIDAEKLDLEKMDLTSKKENDDCNRMRKLYQPASQSSIPGHPYQVYMVTNKFNQEVVDDRMLLPSSKYRVPFIAVPEPQTTWDLKLFSPEMNLKETLTGI